MSTVACCVRRYPILRSMEAIDLSSIVYLLLFFQGEILKTHNTDCLPMPLIVSGSLVSFMWLLYGIAINEMFLQVFLPNSLYFFASLSDVDL